jgi:NADPH:quinone reductase-like Zn-dependent oxidoreductase
MKGAVYRKTKSGKLLEIKELDRPVPKDTEVMLRVCAASVNPLDWRLKQKRPGVDVAGVVVSAGASVTRFKPGDAVFGTGKGAFAEYACARESKLAPKPDNVSFEQAATLPIAGITALEALRDKGQLQAGQKVLINGASGGIGTFAVQIAKAFGATVTGVCSTKNAALVASLGADRVIDYTREDFTSGSERYDVVLDNVGNRTISALNRIVAVKGKCVMAGAPKDVWLVIIGLLKAFVWWPFLRHKFKFILAKIDRDELTRFGELITSGKVTPVIDRRYGLEETADAIAYVEEGHARAKVVITLPSIDGAREPG